MIRIMIELDNEEKLVNEKPKQAMGSFSVDLNGNSTVLANELSIVLYEIFMENPEIVTKALDYCSQRIDKHIKEEE